MEQPESHDAFMEAARAFIVEEIAPAAGPADAAERFDLPLFRELGRRGLLGAALPTDVGGGGLGYAFFYTRLLREVASASASVASGMVAHVGLAAGPILRFGNAEQKARFLPALASGEKLGAFALTERNAGSDMAAVELTAESRGDDYVLCGEKIFITNANVADLFVVAARTGADKGAMGISLFLVEKGTPGLASSGESPRKLGMRASDTGSLRFEDVVVPGAQLLGRKGMGLAMMNHALTGSRIGMAAIALGIAEAAYRASVHHARTREQFGKPIHQFQSVGNMLADMTVGIRAAELLLYRAVEGMERGKNAPVDASIAKLFASETAMKVTKDAIQVFGGHGYYADQPLERYFRDAKLTEIADGSSELQRLLIADEAIRQAAKAKAAK